MFCYISTIPLFSTPKFTNISLKNEKIGALGLNFILDMQYLYFRTRRHYSKKGSRWSAYEVKTEKSCPHVPSIMRGIIEAHLGDAVGLNRKVILERDDPKATVSYNSSYTPTTYCRKYSREEIKSIYRRYGHNH
jgi:hypothetical protein